MTTTQIRIAIAIEQALNGGRAVREWLETRREWALRTGNIRQLAAVELALAELSAVC